MIQLTASMKYQNELGVRIGKRTTQIIRFGMVGILALIIALFALIFILMTEITEITDKLDIIAKKMYCSLSITHIINGLNTGEIVYKLR